MRLIVHAHIIHRTCVHFDTQFLFMVCFSGVSILFLRLRDVWEGCDQTQQQAADFLGCKRQTYSRYERGDAQMSDKSLCRLADHFHTSVDYLLGRTDDPAPYPPSKRKA